MSLKSRRASLELSNAIAVLAVLGLIWFLLAFSFVVRATGGWVGMAHSRYVSLVFAISILVLGAGTFLSWGAIRVRRKAGGFRFSDLPQNEQFVRRKMISAYWKVLGLQGALCALAFIVCYSFDRMDFIWASIAFVVSLHFLHLALVFRVPAFWGVAVVGAAVSVADFLIPLTLASSGARQVILTAGMGTTCWLGAAYIIRNSDQFAATREILNFRTKKIDHFTRGL